MLRLSILYRIPPSEIDKRMTAGDAVAVLNYLAAYPETAETVDIQLAQLIQMIGSVFGAKASLSELRVRKPIKTEIDEAHEWLRFLDERKN